MRRRVRSCPCSAFLRRKHTASLCMSLRGAQRRGNPYSLRQHKTKSNTLGKSEKRHEFAQTAANLPGIPAGMRIAAPVCALVRNDMLKAARCQRLQERGARGYASPLVIARGRAMGQSPRPAAAHGAAGWKPGERFPKSSQSESVAIEKSHAILYPERLPKNEVFHDEIMFPCGN